MKFIKYIRLLLLPVSLIYGLVIRIRNRMFDAGKLPVREYEIPIISVGNITVGGTGKTPLTEFIIKILQADYKLALLSRGYKRKTSGVVIADDKSTAFDIGDEPKQIKDKFKNLTVAVAEKRVDGVNKLLSRSKLPDVIVMDDAYQHRYVKPGLSILVMDYNRPLWKDFMLPAGELREPMKGLKRADIILVSKCPRAISKQQQSYMIKKLNLHARQSVYFSVIEYHKPISLFCNDTKQGEKDLIDTHVFLVTGIANPKPLLQYVKNTSNKVTTLYFPDHYQFGKEDMEKIRTRFEKLDGKKKIIMTTEKDSVRFRQVIDDKDSIASYLWYIPIEIEIMNNQQTEFTNKITSYVKRNKSNC